jgi:DNA topoisomerase-1
VLLFSDFLVSDLIIPFTRHLYTVRPEMRTMLHLSIQSGLSKPSIRRHSRRKAFLCFWLLFVLSLVHCKFVASAFSSRVVYRASFLWQRQLKQDYRNRQSASIRLFAQRKASTPLKQQSLVVHGPTTDFSLSLKKKKTERPFKLVIVESPSKCATIAKILHKYVQEQELGHDYVVTSCMGHIRNLPKQKTSKSQTIAGIDGIENGRYEPTYVILPQKYKLVEDLKDLNNQAQQLILATDDDREGEAMAWHLLEILENKEDNDNSATTTNPDKLPPLRVRFTEITPKAICASVENPATSLNHNLVQAQETRRILDRLAGYTVSPLLWKKIAPGLSAGRVQSVGMALIVQRERERLLFQETEYWDLEADFRAVSLQGLNFPGQLVSINGTVLASGGKDFEPRQANTLTLAARHKLRLQEEGALELASQLDRDEDWSWTVANVTSTERKVNPPPPFITSTLQQEANKRLALSLSRTMQTAQQLYENGFISYMRTDSNHLSEDAQQAIRLEITNEYGGSENYQPRDSKPPKKKTKKTVADKPDPQAAHEAIRPSIQPDGGFIKPSDLPSQFSGATQALYELIYQRTVASHMPPQVSSQTSIRIQGDNGDTTVVFRTSGSVVLKPGFTIVYAKTAEKESLTLPSLREGQRLEYHSVSSLMHVTQPPARYTEASFVQELEALGVGRPSTYAGVVQILRDRAYVGSPPAGSQDSKRGKPKTVSGPAISAQRAAGGEEFTGASNARGPMVPSLSAFVVCSLLEKHCPTYVDPGFTARMEERLDKIANSEEQVGQDERMAYLDEFYGGNDGLKSQIQRIELQVSADEARRANLPALSWKHADEGDIGLFIGPWGPYVQKIRGNNVEECSSGKVKPLTASLPPGMAADLTIITPQTLNAVLSSREKNGTVLGEHFDDGRNIRLKLGRFGAYLQWGEDGEEGTTTHSLPRSVGNMRNMDFSRAEEEGYELSGMLGISLQEAIEYCNLPRTVCVLDELPIIASIGPYGPYLKYNNTYMSLNKGDGDVTTIDSNAAELLVTEGIVNKKSSKSRIAFKLLLFLLHFY